MAERRGTVGQSAAWREARRPIPGLCYLGQVPQKVPMMGARSTLCLPVLSLLDIHLECMKMLTVLYF